MHFRFKWVLSLFFLFIFACSGSLLEPLLNHTITIEAKNVQGTVILKLNAQETLQIEKDGIYAFKTNLPNHTPYQIEIVSKPTIQECFLSAANGNITDDLKITLDCKTYYSVSATVSNMPATVSQNLVLNLNNLESLNISANGTFTFTNMVLDGKSYSLTVTQQPKDGSNNNYTCTVSPDSGIITSANVAVSVSCVQNYTLTVNGISGSVEVTEKNSNTILTSSSSSMELPDGTNYNLEITKHLSGATCFFTPAPYSYTQSGTISSANVTYTINCYTYGSFDSSFGSIGVSKIPTIGTGGLTDGFDILADSDGSIFISGTYSTNSTADNIVLWKLQEIGITDTSFASPNGFLLYNAGSSDFHEGHSVLKINNAGNTEFWVFGKVPVNTIDAVLIRYNTSGTQLGISTYGKNLGDGIYDAVLHPNGYVYATGYHYNGSNSDLVLWRFASNGNLDSSFGGSCAVGDTSNKGCIILDAASLINGNAEGKGIAVDNTGKIIVVGWEGAGVTPEKMVVWRFLEDGTLDTTFNATGYFVHDGAAGTGNLDTGLEVAIDSNNNIYVVGVANDGSNNRLVVWKVLSTGSLDPNFGSGSCKNAVGTGGNYGCFAYFNFSGVVSDYEYAGITLDSSGRILTVTSFSNTNSDIAILRLLPSGSLDTSFNSTGVVTYNGGNNEYGRQITTDNLGRILVVGGDKANYIYSLRLIP